MANQDHLDLLIHSVDAWNQWRDNNTDIIPDLQGANLSHHDLRNANLIGANLYGAILYGANLSGAFLRKANLRYADLTSAICFRAMLGKADLRNAFLTQADLSKAYLKQANLSDAYLLECYLIDTNLQEANLEGADLSKSCLTGANLEKANLKHANLSHADLIAAKIAETNFEGAKLIGVMVDAQILDKFYQVKTCVSSNNYNEATTISNQDSDRPLAMTSGFSMQQVIDENFRLIAQIEQLKLENLDLQLQLQKASQEYLPIITSVSSLNRPLPNYSLIN